LRQLVNRSDFLIQAQQALGYPIKVISGEQEACFIYQGLLDQLACPEQTTLVIDIGGGSTEFIIGQGKQTQLLHSLDVGCLGYSQRYFSQGQISKQRLEQASLAACQAVATIAPHITSHNWQLAVGTSGAIQLLQQVVNACGWDQPCQLSAASLAKLSELTAGFSHTRQLALAGLNLQRREIFPASLAILRGIFTALNLTTLGYIEGGLIRGLLEQLLVRQRSAVAAN
jgi:exopolyphosphatase/guanosine-5'-triphosphate,3'-diphosphate pyrophosphatase